MHISIHSKQISQHILYLLTQKTRKIASKTNNLTILLKNILDSARNQSNADIYNDCTPLYLLKIQSTALISKVNSLNHIDKETRSVIGKTALALLHCYSNNGYLDPDFASLLLNNIYLKGCSPRAILTILESLHKSDLLNDRIYTIFNQLLTNQKTLVSLAAQDLCQLLWRFIAIHEIYPFYTCYKYYYTIGTLIMHCRKRIRYCLRKGNDEDRIAWSIVGGNRALEDFSMAIKLFSHSSYCKSGCIVTYDDHVIRNNLRKLHMRQLIAMNELLKTPLRGQYRHTNTSDTAKKVINSLQELLQVNEFSDLFGGNSKICYELPVMGTRYSIDILLSR
ncbi:hypothetical protein BMR1_03g01520 [Babesia microti strain RI]|uniref:Uncharacterized protein n=1 Tax=Babesia microti (strain RI) TaxID=1133968 RepID=A0A0K3AQJ4_BABMR|nr:hypothetical protein BMR1_03g01520 [Babesia microti strain RI]CTQ40903.1 hypothetical protein BMR1_03g01520 [Babesia microti strain RI]|eukprot:XP_012648914.1 hypothetical protein BMR1_03g01520 [Babesia microti strain RI]